jgi:cellular nucleic acid-binding protein
MKGMVRWFNATKGSGFITPDNGSGYIYFSQPSLKFDGRDGHRILHIGDSIEFEIRADWDGRPRAFDITAPGSGAHIGGFHPDGGNHGCDYACYGKDGGLGYDGVAATTKATNVASTAAVTRLFPFRCCLEGLPTECLMKCL